MFGVILWSDTKSGKAVIWCEDHGDLAFYNEEAADLDLTLDPGDWVQFDLRTERNLRIARNPRLVAQQVCKDLAETLGSLSLDPEMRDECPGSARTAQIIPFGTPRDGAVGTIASNASACSA